MKIHSLEKIDLTAIRRILSDTAKKIRGLFKNVMTMPYAKRYVIAAPFLTLFFLIMTFPLEVLVKNGLHKLEGTAVRSIQSGDMSIGLFRDWTIESLSITTNGKSDISFTNVLCDFSTFGLFTKSISGDFSIDQFRYSTDTVTASCALRSGDAKISLDSAQNIPNGGRLSFTLTDIALKGLTARGFNIPPIKAGTVKASFLFSPKLMTISEGTISGKDLSGHIRGTITVDQNFQRSQLNITCEIDAKSALLADYKLILGSFINQETDTLPISITGPLYDPSVNFANGPAGGPPGMAPRGSSDTPDPSIPRQQPPRRR
jgi:hypothetical protein